MENVFFIINLLLNDYLRLENQATFLLVGPAVTRAKQVIRE